MVCRSAFSRLPTAQSEIEARHRCLQPATSPRESYGFQHEGGKPVRFAGLPLGRLPTAQSKIEARHRCSQPATSPRETFGFQRGAAESRQSRDFGAYHQRKAGVTPVLWLHLMGELASRSDD